MLILIMKNMADNIIYIVQELYTFLCSFKVTLVNLFSLIFSIHSSTSLSISLFLKLQFS